MKYESPTIEMLGDDQMAHVAGEGLFIFYIFVIVALAFLAVAADTDAYYRRRPWYRKWF